MKRIVSVLLALIFVLGAVSCAEGTVNVAALNGPTGMGMVKMMKDEEGKEAYAFTLAGAPDMITPKLIKGELDIACVPANLASVLYNKTQGNIQVLAVNTLGVLYIVERGDSVSTIADLKGRTVYASGMGSTPEYALNYLLRENGLDPETDVDIQWKSEHSECLMALIGDDTACAMLPQPFVTVAQSKKDDIRIAVDMTAEWDRLDNGSGMITGVVCARADFVKANPDKAAAFLEEYAASVEYVNAHNEEAASLIGEYGIIDAAVALKALPYCNIVCVTGEEMHFMLSGYLNVLAAQDASAVGGKVPDEDFYFVP